jgi:hypothetical protein
MKLYSTLPGSKAESNIRSISRKLKISVLSGSTGQIDGIIIIGNGSPDAEVVCLIAHHLNGSKTVGITKPRDRTGLGVIQSIPTYLKTQRITKILILLDQEEYPTERIFKETEKTLTNEGLSVGIEREKKRLKIYKWDLQNRDFTLIIAINGLDEIASKRHCIEDHLVKTSHRILGIPLSPKDLDSKMIWETKLRDRQDQVFNKLKEERNLLDDIFPQQIEGLTVLKACLD